MTEFKKKKKRSQVSSRAKAWKSTGFQFLCKHSCFSPTALGNQNNHSQNAFVNPAVFEVFFFFLTEMNCSLNKPLLSSHPRLFWKEYWLHSMQLQCMDFPILQLGLPLNLLTTSPLLLTFLLFTLPQPFFHLLQKKLPYAMLLLFCLFHWFWTLKGLVYVSSCLCSLYLSMELYLTDFTCAAMRLKNCKN